MVSVHSIGEGPKYLHEGFGVGRSLARNDDWKTLLEEWYKYENREFPDREGA